MIHGMIRLICSAFFLAFISLSAVHARETAELSDEQVMARLEFLTNALDSAQPRAKAWRYGWISAYSAGAVVLGGLAIAHWDDVKTDEISPESREVRDRGFAEDMLVGSVTCALGAGGLLINPFEPATSPGRWRLIPERTPEERRTKLLEAEELLRRCARREKDGQGWLTHILNLGVNAAAGVVTVVAFDRPWTDGLLTFATGETVSLLNIYTQPRRAIRDLKNYEIRFLGGQGAYQAGPSERTLSFRIRPGGFSVGLRF